MEAFISIRLIEERSASARWRRSWITRKNNNNAPAGSRAAGWWRRGSTTGSTLTLANDVWAHDVTPNVNFKTFPILTLASRGKLAKRPRRCGSFWSHDHKGWRPAGRGFQLFLKVVFFKPFTFSVYYINQSELQDYAIVSYTFMNGF